MDRKQFEQRVLTSAGPSLLGSRALKAALFDAGQKKERFYEQDVREALAQARVLSKGRFQDAREEADGVETRDEVRKRPGAEAYLISNELVKSLAPQVASLRKERFGSTVPRFPSSGQNIAARDAAIKKAAAWIEDESRKNLEKWREARTPDAGLIEKKIERLAKEAGYDGCSLSQSPFLPYFGPPNLDFQKQAPTAPDTFLASFARQVIQWSKNTNIMPGHWAMHVLTGFSPLLSRVRSTRNRRAFELPSGKQAHMRSMTLTFNTADLTFDELREIYNNVRVFLGGRGQKAPTFEDLEFWELVQDMEGPPEKNIRKFWTAVRDRWNAEHPGTQPLRSWEGFQDRYQRLERRLEVGPGPTSHERQMTVTRQLPARTSINNCGETQREIA